jgi:hypothetical protein
VQVLMAQWATEAVEVMQDTQVVWDSPAVWDSLAVLVLDMQEVKV